MNAGVHVSQHARLKHAVASSLRQYISHLPTHHSGEVKLEERILDGARRIDVSLHREFGNRSHSWAFEIKATLGDSFGAHSQLEDYDMAGYTPVFVKKKELHPDAGDEPQSIVSNASEHAAVAEAKLNGGTVTFAPLCGFHNDVCLSGLSDYWAGREFALDIHEQRRMAVLTVLAEGRANPYLIREEADLNKGDTNTVLNRLARLGYVEQVTRGLYEITESGKRRVRDD